MMLFVFFALVSGADRREANPQDKEGVFKIHFDAHEGRRDTYLKIKVKIKHLQKLKLNIFPAKIKHSLDKKFSKFDKKLKKVFIKFCENLGLERCEGF